MRRRRQYDGQRGGAGRGVAGRSGDVNERGTTLGRAEVERIAQLARLALTEEEVTRLGRELGAILEWVRQLEELDVSAVDPTAHAVPLAAPLREDAPRPGLTRDDALANAPERLAGQVVVPRVV